MDITISNALLLIFISAACGLIGQSFRTVLGIIKDYTNSLKHKNDDLEKCLQKRSAQISEELQAVKDSKKAAALRREKMFTDGISRRHATLYNSWSKSFFDWERLGVSAAISISIGAFAGIFYLLSGLVNGADVITQFNILSSMAAGYVGTDVIEGFMNKNKITIPTKIEKPE